AGRSACCSGSARDTELGRAASRVTSSCTRAQLLTPSSGAHSDSPTLHPFPTRRSSDLQAATAAQTEYAALHIDGAGVVDEGHSESGRADACTQVTIRVREGVGGVGIDRDEITVVLGSESAADQIGDDTGFVVAGTKKQT